LVGYSRVRIEKDLKITFDDVLIKPAHSDIVNREAEIDISVAFLGKRIAPIISSNMDYVTGVKMAIAMQLVGALGIVNRFESIYDQQLDLQNIAGTYPKPFYISVGIRDIDDSANRIKVFNLYGVCIDVAHGDHERV